MSERPNPSVAKEQPMDDFTATRLCAEAMESAGALEFRRSESGELVTMIERFYYWTKWNDWSPYDPLHDDARAMALVKRFRLRIKEDEEGNWCVWLPHKVSESVESHDLNRAIVYAVANMYSVSKEKK